MSEEEAAGFPWEEFAKMTSDNIPDDMLDRVIHPMQMRKRIIRDLVPCDSVLDVVRLLKLAPASPDVEEMEHDESHSRLDAIAPLQEVIAMLSAFAAEAAAGAIMVSQGVTEVTPEMGELVVKTAPVIHMGVISVLAELVDAGYLHLPHGFFVQVGEQ